MYIFPGCTVANSILILGSKKVKQRDDGETTQVTGPYPEDVFSCDARQLYKMVRRLIPLKAETIKVADRKMIRETADELMERLVQITGIVKELRHNLKLKDQKIEEVQKAKNVSIPIFSYAERVKAAQIMLVLPQNRKN
ncbi:uncharacterized protein LOC108739602 [Agrilus planipennis]|uniref:Uncharacterized protein LOC108739602 n=1 Tax=Agrilus planipennis TaxID=224129 RepID=A0A1W4X9S4_AGRPL|nr:uncharacterized protein LOC108739602 [Agrilus planipennis]